MDLLAESPAPFEGLWERADRMTVGDLVVPVASLDDVIAMKRRSGRPKDLLDVEELLQLRDGR